MGVPDGVPTARLYDRQEHLVCFSGDAAGRPVLRMFHHTVQAAMDHGTTLTVLSLAVEKVIHDLFSRGAA